jgi:hypothetical protein
MMKGSGAEEKSGGEPAGLTIYSVVFARPVFLNLQQTCAMFFRLRGHFSCAGLAYRGRIRLALVVWFAGRGARALEKRLNLLPFLPGKAPSFIFVNPAPLATGDSA